MFIQNWYSIYTISKGLVASGCWSYRAKIISVCPIKQPFALGFYSWCDFYFGLAEAGTLAWNLVLIGLFKLLQSSSAPSAKFECSSGGCASAVVVRHCGYLSEMVKLDLILVRLSGAPVSRMKCLTDYYYFLDVVWGWDLAMAEGPVCDDYFLTFLPPMCLLAPISYQ